MKTSIQAELNKKYFEQIRLDSVLALAKDDFAKNQIRNYALLIAQDFRYFNKIQEVKRKAAFADWITREAKKYQAIISSKNGITILSHNFFSTLKECKKWALIERRKHEGNLHISKLIGGEYQVIYIKDEK